MSALTYDSLVESVINYCERDDDPFIAQIPSFIAMCENRLSAEVKPLGFVRVVTGVTTTNTVNKPIRWRRTKAFTVTVGGERQFLYQRSYEYCRLYTPDPSTTGTPLYYADYDFEHLFLAPTPTPGLPFELSYWERPEPLSEVSQTNWTTQYAPQLLLYGTLLEAMPFLKTSERIAEFQQLFDRALVAIVQEDEQRQMDSAAQRSK